MQSSRDIIILLEPGTASQNFWQPKLAHSTLHVSDLPLRWWGGLDPLRGFPANTTDHVRMGQGFRGPLRRLDIQGGRDGLGDARMQRRGPAGDQEVVALLARHGTVASRWAGEGGVSFQ